MSASSSAIIALAYCAHAGQVDKTGETYIAHPQRVAHVVHSSGGGAEGQLAAWLHDTVEDTWVTVEHLRDQMVGERVIELVELLTRTGKADEAYYAAIREDPLARLIKACDIHDNLDPVRLAKLPEAEATRLRAKYGRALVALFG